jgi:hypothetical protein
MLEIEAISDFLQREGPHQADRCLYRIVKCGARHGRYRDRIQ